MYFQTVYMLFIQLKISLTELNPAHPPLIEQHCNWRLRDIRRFRSLFRDRMPEFNGLGISEAFTSS
jgi:hypothetical protein